MVLFFLNASDQTIVSGCLNEPDAIVLTNTVLYDPAFRMDDLLIATHNDTSKERKDAYRQCLLDWFQGVLSFDRLDPAPEVRLGLLKVWAKLANQAHKDLELGQLNHLIEQYSRSLGERGK